MSIILSLLSGKGGSGKTTMALSMSVLLSECGVKTLLIDCDLTTNGATYFYEDDLSNENISSFCDLLHNENSNNFIKINEYMDFMPSINRIDTGNANSYNYRYKNDFNTFKRFCEEVRKIYDVIILDCQAGYTDVLKIILPEVDLNLFVMEADAISSSAIRSLYLKIGKIIENKKSFQVINKATKDEYETYSKSSGITLFTNIETIIFDWKIRKAFSMAQIPDMKNTSAYFGMQIYGICKFLFKNEATKSKISKYKSIIDYNNNLKRKLEIETEIENIKSNKMFLTSGRKKNLHSALIFLLILVEISILLIFINYSSISSLSWNYLEIIMIFIATATSLVFAIITFTDAKKERRAYYNELERCNNGIYELEKANNELLHNHKDLRELLKND